MCVCVGGGGGDMNFHCAEFFQFGIFGLFSELFDVMHSFTNGELRAQLGDEKARKLAFLYEKFNASS